MIRERVEREAYLGLGRGWEYEKMEKLTEPFRGPEHRKEWEKLRAELEPTSKLSELLQRLTEAVRSGAVPAVKGQGGGKPAKVFEQDDEGDDEGLVSFVHDIAKVVTREAGFMSRGGRAPDGRLYITVEGRLQPTLEEAEDEFKRVQLRIFRTIEKRAVVYEYDWEVSKERDEERGRDAYRWVLYAYLTPSEEAKSIASSAKEERELTKQQELVYKLERYFKDLKGSSKRGSEAAARKSFRYVVNRINGVLSILESLLVYLDLPVSLEVGVFVREVRRILGERMEEKPDLNYTEIARSFERMEQASSKGEGYVGEYEKGFAGFHRFGEVVSEIIEAVGDVLSEMGEESLAKEALGVAGKVRHEFLTASPKAEESRDPQRRMRSEAGNPVDYARIAREFDHIREVGMEGIRSAREGSFLRVGNGVAAVLDSLGNILAALGESHLGDRAAMLADEVREATRPEVRPDESERTPDPSGLV